MKRIAGIRFERSGKIMEYDARNLELAEGDKVMVDWDEGLKLGTVLKLTECDDSLLPPQPLPRVIRKATEADLDYESRKVHKERELHQACLAKLTEMGLDMKLVEVEHIPNINKFICYFTSEGRIDFRNLVKSLATDFHARVEMRQIGARNRSKMVGGIGRCGRELCCCSFLQDFEPITVKMAKDQGLALDPTKISGVCGRLMCCLTFEHEIYEHLKKTLPKCGKKVVTECGAGKVIKQDILRQKVWVKLDSGNEIEISPHELRQEGTPKAGGKK
jgi:cell fate regulator YaaT (PSP1 superfamily)